MKMQEILVGGRYVVKANTGLMTVRVDAIRSVPQILRPPVAGGAKAITERPGYIYDVTILATGRKTAFGSAAKFLNVADDAEVASGPS